MGVTYRTAADREAAGERRRLRQFGRADAAFLMLSAGAILLVLLAAAGRLMVLGEVQPAARPIDLNRVTDAASLELSLAEVFQWPADRRLAARELARFLAHDDDGGRRALPNVGRIARARVRAETIDHASGATAFRERLAAERARAAELGQPQPASVALLTSAEIAALKPLLAVRSRQAFVQALVLWLVLYVLAFQVVSVFWKSRGVRGDRVLLSAAHVLTAVGLAAMVSRSDPLRDQLLFVRYTQGVIVGAALAAVTATVRLRSTPLPQLTYVPLMGAGLLSVALLLFGNGPAGSQARVNLGPVQPIEAIRLLLALFLTGYFARRWELLRLVRGEAARTLSWLNVPRSFYLLPVLTGVAGALVLFFLQRDLGPALILSVVFLAVYAVARGTLGLAVGGAGLLAAAFFVGYELNIPATLADRVRMWNSPWDNMARGGDQIAQAFWAMSAGGSLGTGLGLGDTRYLPAGHTDLVLAALAEELGAAGLMIVAGLYAAVVCRALSTARRASSEYDFFLAVVLALFLAVPVALVSAGLLGLVPLTGVVTPFLSYGGSAMAANFVAIGLLSSVRTSGTPDAAPGVFRAPLRGLSLALATVAAVILAAVVRIQIVEPDRLLVRPHLGVQGDGSRRFQYNPRVLEVARTLPRGTIFDRRGLPLASDDHGRLEKASVTYAEVGIAPAEQCGDDGGRCYPLAGRAFHLLGDATTRVNFSAGNTAFVERDAESRLRGFDDHATVVRVPDGRGGETPAVRRDYSALVPMVRFRHQPRHPAVVAFRSRPRDVGITVDGRLQVRVAAIIATYAARSTSGRAAAVVIDPDTGDLLASVSYPWPRERPDAAAPTEDELLDRARFGLYPPGSTFKIVTAAAALGRDPQASGIRFTCARLPDGRIGAKLPGWSRPVRDDVLDRQPHGTIAMARALAVSCNAYFAQLALKLGPGPLIELAKTAGLSLAPGNDSARVRATLPQVGYGQADVLASPLQMARLAAAIAAGGVLREVRVYRSLPPADGTRLLPAESARVLAGFMRAAVLEGSGWRLRDHAIAIAGKTGTAEVDGGRAHAWFAGFAANAQARHRIAVAVIIEHAGYGGVAAAPAAGEIIAAAAAEGLI